MAVGVEVAVNTVATGQSGKYKKRCRVETTGAATGEFYCALDATLSVPVRLCLFPWGRVWETENGRAAGMTSACRGGHGGETRRVKVGRGCGPQRRVGVCPESLGPRRPSTSPHTPPPGGRISGLKDNEWKRCNARPQQEAGTVGRVPDAQMQRGAMPHSCQKLGATF